MAGMYLEIGYYHLVPNPYPFTILEQFLMSLEAI
jgi:hypothetical protein